jgi:hypothetical protein
MYTVAAHMNYGQQLRMMQGRQRNLRQSSKLQWIATNLCQSVVVGSIVFYSVAYDTGEVEEVEVVEWVQWVATLVLQCVVLSYSGF